jgi:hypothetical protein
MSNARENVNLLTSTDWDIATLRLANWGSGAVPPQVVLKQNLAAGDSGGMYRYDASDTTTADDNWLVIVDAAGNRWKRQLHAIKAAGEINIRAIEARITDRRVLSTAYGADPTGNTDSSAGLQLLINSITGRSAVIEIPAGTWAFTSSVIIPQGKRLVFACAADAFLTTSANIPILKYNRTTGQDGTYLYGYGGFFVFGGTQKTGGKAIEFFGFSISEHDNRLYWQDAEFRYFQTAIDLKYTGADISHIKALENGTTIGGGPDASFVTISDLVDQNSDYMISLTGAGEAAGITNGLRLQRCAGIGIKRCDIKLFKYDSAAVLECSGDLGGTVGVTGDAALWIEQCTNTSVTSGYWASRGTAFNYSSNRFERYGIYVLDCWRWNVDDCDFIGNWANIRAVNSSPAGIYFGVGKITNCNFQATRGTPGGAPTNTYQHFIGLGVETVVISNNTFTLIDYDAPTFHMPFYGNVTGSKNWKCQGNFIENSSYTVALDGMNMEDLDNTWSARVRQ